MAYYEHKFQPNHALDILHLIGQKMNGPLQATKQYISVWLPCLLPETELQYFNYKKNYNILQQKQNVGIKFWYV